MDGNIHPFPSPVARLLVVSDTEADHAALVDALTAYLAANRAENAYATLVATARRCGCPVGEPVIGWAKRFAVKGLTHAIAANRSLERAVGGRTWAVGSEDGAA